MLVFTDGVAGRGSLIPVRIRVASIAVNWEPLESCTVFERCCGGTKDAGMVLSYECYELL